MPSFGSSCWSSLLTRTMEGTEDFLRLDMTALLSLLVEMAALVLLVTLAFAFWMLLLLLVLEKGVSVPSGRDLAGLAGT